MSVDDDDRSREMLHTALQRAGASVISVSCAGDAVAELGRVWPDILLSDLGLPAEDGYELMKKIRSLPSSGRKPLPAIALSGYADKASQLAAEYVGYQWFIAKPVNLGELIEVIRRLTAISESE
ncbi:response regulator [Undibacterium arcticum]